jgi:hypothetical protein
MHPKELEYPSFGIIITDNNKLTICKPEDYEIALI